MKQVHNIGQRKFLFEGGAILPGQVKKIPEAQAELLTKSFPYEIVAIAEEEKKEEKKPKK